MLGAETGALFQWRRCLKLAQYLFSITWKFKQIESSPKIPIHIQPLLTSLISNKLASPNYPLLTYPFIRLSRPHHALWSSNYPILIQLSISLPLTKLSIPLHSQPTHPAFTGQQGHVNWDPSPQKHHLSNTSLGAGKIFPISAPEAEDATFNKNSLRSRGTDLGFPTPLYTFKAHIPCMRRFCVRSCHTPSTTFQHLPPNSARFSYATEGALFISAQLSTDTAPSERFGYW